MSDVVKVALILGAAAIICVGLLIYFSEYQTCVRAALERGAEATRAKMVCAKFSN